ncbi:unnamed protein product [Cladocopium goreaui]|uniref:Potassium voltage-gated channel subfamily H member 1 n=1 Tax=Cladocopium goreaui TaxID=2562237 RepID=A0A9P1BUY9_9DINO|nr:unnamed protein product [Cladocopium goreaui]
MASVNVLPTDAELAAFSNPADIVAWTGLSADVWTIVDNSLGKLPHIRLIASLPLGGLKAALQQARVPVTGGEPRELNLAESIQEGLWHGRCGSIPGRVFFPSVSGSAMTSAQKKVKLSQVLDQVDETETPLLGRADMDQAFANHPNHESEPTPEQIASMYQRVVQLGEPPYADFSILTPYGKRAQKQMKARAWTIQQDGTFRALEVPGPPTYKAWAACWRVFRSLLFMLKHPSSGNPVATPACSEEYFENVTRLNEDYPETCYLIMQAEDRCRAEMLERHRRTLTKAAAENRLPMNLEFNPAQPWVGCFIFAARDQEYWMKHVIRPAQNFLARGGRQMTMEKAENIGAPSARPPRKRRRGRDAEAPPLPSPKKSGKPGAGGQDSHPRKWGTHYITDQDGTELCFRFAKGKANACPEPCRDKRTHGCQHCLGNHSNENCPHHVKKTGKEGPKGIATVELEKIAASASFDSNTDKSPLESLTYVKVGRHQNALVKASAVRETEMQRVNSKNAPSSSLTIAEKRELENSLCVGGLRDPQAAVAKSWKLRQVGARLRAVLDIHLTTGVTQRFEDEPQSCPFSVAELREVRTAVAKEFNADVSHEGYEAELFDALLKTADDPDAATIYDWLKFGFPLGVKCRIKNNGVFPATDEVSAAIQASKTIGTLASDWSGEARNYTSFAEAGPLAEEELERLLHLGRADKVGSWREVVDLIGQDAVLTPLACIVKVKDGKAKTRLIVDMRRSGICGQVSLFERVVMLLNQRWH